MIRGKALMMNEELMKMQKEVYEKKISDKENKEENNESSKLNVHMKKFKASDGWLTRFKAQHGMREIRVAGEKLSADTESADNARSEENKERVTIMTCTNATGSHKIPLLMIGKSAKPRCFRTTKAELPVIYASQSISWMTGELFLEWYKTVFIKAVKERKPDENEKFLVILDNLPCHPSEEELNKIDPQFRVLYLPPNVTSLIQPMDQGSIESMKRNDEKIFLRRMLDDDKPGNIVNFVKNWTMIDTAFAVASAWNNVPEKTISKCWKKLLGDQAQVVKVCDSIVTDVTCLLNSVTSSEIHSNKDVEAWFQGEENLETCKTLTDQEIMKNAFYAQNENLNQLQVQTPPGSNKSGGLHEESRLEGLSKHNSRSVGALRPEELSKMFPTPPSLEHNPVASPCQLNDPPMEQTELSASQRSFRHLPDIYPNMGSPPEESIEDWSYVFKPSTVCKLVGSSKYAPLTNLPSQSLPPISLPAHCVYRPSWQCNNSASNISEKTAQTTRASSVQQLLCPPSPAPAGAGAPYRPATISGRQPPPPYDQPSPATSTTSSYLNKNPNSIEADTPGPTRMPESNSLVVNILLGDTALNIFRDHNFDSCSLCVCNASPKVVGNIKGADAGVYLASSWGPSSALFQEEDQIRCSCGFSAVVNRRLAHRAGLFYEDEMEITGIAEDPADKKKCSLSSLSCNINSNKQPDTLDSMPPDILDLLREQCLIVQSSASSLYRAARIYAMTKSCPSLSSAVNTLEFNDGNEVSLAALDQGKVDGTQNERMNRVNGVHQWAFLRARGPECSGDIVRMMRTLQPLLQEAVQKKCTTRMWEAPYTVAGPLTWRQFHRLAGRGADDRCEPQPIPALVVGYDRDWLSLSPYALSYWEKLLLEPYAGSRDVAYVVVAPDSECVIKKVKTFFRELSTTYEICRLGRHAPISKALRDGILRVGKSATEKFSKQPIDEWFKLLGENQIGELLRLYALVCNHRLAPYLTQVIQDRSLLDTVDGQSNKQQQSQQQSQSQQTPPQQQQQQSTIAASEGMPITPDGTLSKPESVEGENPHSETPNATSNINSTIGNTTPTSVNSTAASSTIGPDDEQVEPPAVVVYLVEPFSLGGTENLDRRRLAILALLRAYSAAVSNMPESVRSNINVQLISLESVMELGRAREKRKIQDEMRALALTVFLQGRRLLNHNSTVKSLTGFGTAAAADLFLKNKDSFSNTLATLHQERNKAPYRLYAPAYVLAPLRGKSEAPESFGIAGPEECAVLYLSYCLSEDQSLILAVATDDRGEIYENTTINIDVPNRKRRKRASARRIGLQKLMDFILGVMSQGVQPWRLVVGRIGRIGHGELKGWSWLLSRKALLKASKHLKEICGQCSLLYPTAAPCVLSACLVSLEPDSTLRLMADQFTPDERFSQASVNCQLSTPQDVTCTHILVFPTSATTQSSQTAFQEQHINGPELGDEELFSALNDDMPEGMEGMGDFNDIFNVWPEAGAGGGQSPSGSPHRPEESPLGGDRGGSGLGNHDGPGSPFQCNTPRITVSEQTEEVGTLLQQPLALGYLVSTAPTGRMPPWFWAACPHLEGVCPVFLKNALHLHSPAIQQNSDDLLQQQSALTAHPLDSQYTTDVLRYVLEGYNALSWLAVDANTKDRLSCLPVHVQALMKLYHTAAALV